MKGDSCSLTAHKDRIAIGYGTTSYSGLNVCVECAKGYSKENLKLYGITKQDEETFNKKSQQQNEQQLKDIEEGKPLLVGNNRGDNWQLYGQDALEFLDKDVLNYSNFKDNRSNYYDSSD